MRRALMMIFLSFNASFALAFQDHAVQTHLDELRSRLSAGGDVTSRLAEFDRFRDSFNHYLDGDTSGPQPAWGAAPIGKTDQEMAEFASLNEFAAALLSVRLSPPNKANCDKAKKKATREGSYRENGQEDGKLVLAPSAQLVVELIDLVCR